LILDMAHDLDALKEWYDKWFNFIS
jgi:hypothetical protein